MFREIGPVVLKKILKFYQYIFHSFVIISPWKSVRLEQTWIPLTQVRKLVEIGPVVLKKTDDDDDGQRISWDQKMSLESSAQVT